MCKHTILCTLLMQFFNGSNCLSLTFSSSFVAQITVPPSCIETEGNLFFVSLHRINRQFLTIYRVRHCYYLGDPYTGSHNENSTQYQRLYFSYQSLFHMKLHTLVSYKYMFYFHTKELLSHSINNLICFRVHFLRRSTDEEVAILIEDVTIYHSHLHILLASTVNYIFHNVIERLHVRLL